MNLEDKLKEKVTAYKAEQTARVCYDRLIEQLKETLENDEVYSSSGDTLIYSASVGPPPYDPNQHPAARVRYWNGLIVFMQGVEEDMDNARQHVSLDDEHILDKTIDAAADVTCSILEFTDIVCKECAALLSYNIADIQEKEKEAIANLVNLESALDDNEESTRHLYKSGDVEWRRARLTLCTTETHPPTLIPQWLDLFESCTSIMADAHSEELGDLEDAAYSAMGAIERMIKTLCNHKKERKEEQA